VAVEPRRLQIRGIAESTPEITAVHDLHIWAMGATKPALTAHMVRPEGGDDAFLAALAAFASVGVIVLRETPHLFWTTMIMLGWMVGVIMQIVAGTIARTRN